MSLGTTIKSIQDIMRKDVGVDGDAQRISQLVWMLFLKIFDDQRGRAGADRRRLQVAAPGTPPLAQLGRRRRRASPATSCSTSSTTTCSRRSRNCPPRARTRRVAGVVRGVFEDAYNYMKSGTLLRQVINKLNEIDFNNAERPPPVRRHLRADPRATCRAPATPASTTRRAPSPSSWSTGQPEARRDDPRPRLRHRRLSHLRHRAHPQAST